MDTTQICPALICRILKRNLREYRHCECVAGREEGGTHVHVLSAITKGSYQGQFKVQGLLGLYLCAPSQYISLPLQAGRRTAVAQRLRCCATNRKVAGSIPDGVSGFFIDIKYFRSHYGPGVDSASNRNEYQEYFLGVKGAGA